MSQSGLTKSVRFYLTTTDNGVVQKDDLMIAINAVNQVEKPMEGLAVMVKTLKFDVAINN